MKFMDSQSLRQQLPQLQAQKFAGMSDDDLLAYVRIFYSLYHMVSVNSLADEYGTPALYRRKITTLYRMLCRRYYKRGTIAEKAKILNTLYTLVHCTEYSLDEKICREYVNEGDELISQYLPTVVDRPVTDMPMTDADFYMMRLILIQWYGLVDTDELPGELAYVRRCLDSWKETISADGTWKDITERQALQRIDIYSLDADLMSDETYGDIVRKAYANYCTPRHTDNFMLMHDIIAGLTNAGPDSTAHLIRLASFLPENTIQAKSVSIGIACRQVAEEVQESIVL